ncbi:MAG: sulfatase-like hydrolase/transferase [Planctomycetes bacterium]|nr:sulfatase-like hydrolase/transferase [Planctomycetota bacterium]
MMSRIVIVRRGALAAALGLGALTGCSSKATGRGVGDNVIVVSMDTTRADALGCYGNATIRTPNIDRLARRGTLFRQCTSTAPITLTAHSSLLTGTDPYVHGARDNGRYRLSPENVTLAEILARDGWSTAAFVGGIVLDREYGLDQGFDLYDDVSSSRRRDASPSAPTPLERRADEVANRAITWLRSHATGKFFLFVHFYDPHDPYEPPQRFREATTDPYLGEIAFVDEQIGRLLDAVREIGVESRTLVTLTADHGESRGQHGEETHSYTVYDCVLRVPLVVSAPGGIPAGREVDAQVRSIDVVPTILDFLALPPKPDAQGTSLLPLALGETPDLGLAAYGETLCPFEQFRYSPVRCLRVGGWKYVHAPRPELYHVSDDPDELRDLAAQFPDRVLAMQRELRARIAAAPHAGQSGRLAGPMDEEKRKALAALGYVGDDAGATNDVPATASEMDLFDPKCADPKDHMPEIKSLQLAMTALARGQLSVAEAAFRKTLELDPTEGSRYAMCHENLALVLASAGKTDEAIEHYRTSLAANPQSPTAHVNYGTTLSKLGRTDEAIEHFRAALVLNPAYATAHNDLARALLQAGHSDEAVLHYREALRLRPTYFEVYPRLATALRAKHQLDEVAGLWEAALRADPDFQQARQELAVALIDEHQHGRAEQVLRDGLARSPDDAGVKLALARLLATSPRAEDRNAAEAVRLAESLAGVAGDRDPRYLDTLAAAYAESGRFSDAARLARRAADLLAAQGQAPLANDIRARVALYEAGRPYHETD